MEIAVFVSAGLGDALLLVPLVKQLKKQGAKIAGIFTSSFQCENLFTDTHIFDEIIVSKNGISSIASSLKNFRKFDLAYLNFFAATKKNFLLAKSISKKVVTNNSHLADFSSQLVFIQPQQGIHDATQNLRLVDPSINDSFLKEEMFQVGFQKIKLIEKKVKGSDRLKDKKYFAIQISSGNNIQPFKNWTTRHWIEFLKLTSIKFPEHHFILLGEPAEAEIANSIISGNIPQVYSAVGKTEISEAVEFIRNSELFIGLDGGLMHIAVATGKPTFTLWGGSDFNLYGYEKINPFKHKIVFHQVSCRPCNSWIAPNTTRVNDPLDCPDYICMQNLTAAFAFSEFQEYYNKLFHS